MTKKKILVVDDEPNIVQLLKDILVPANYEVIGAYNGEQALKMAQEENPDVIILDIILPVINGFEVCKKLKKNSKTRNIPVIMNTAAGLEDVARDEPEVQAEVYLAKPYVPKELVNIVQNVIEKHSKQ